MTCVERDPQARAWRNTDPKQLIKSIEEGNWPEIHWTTYSFANRKLWDDVNQRYLRDEDIIGKMMLFYQQLSRRTKQSIEPKLFVSWSTKTLHFHVIECSTGITRKARAQTFRKVFQRFHKWPKNLYNTVIHSKPFDSSKGALFYASGGHNELFTKPFGPRRTVEAIPTEDPFVLELLAALEN